MSSFKKAKELGDRGEEKVKDWFLKKPWVKDVETVSGMKDQFSGKDLFITLNDGSQLSVEVKTELEDKYGNLFLETWSNKSSGRRGWIYTCKSDWFIYQFINESWGYMFETKNLQSWFETCNVPEKPQRKWVQNNDSWGRPANIQLILAQTNSKIIIY